MTLKPFAQLQRNDILVGFDAYGDGGQWWVVSKRRWCDGWLIYAGDGVRTFALEPGLYLTARPSARTLALGRALSEELEVEQPPTVRLNWVTKHLED